MKAPARHCVCAYSIFSRSGLHFFHVKHIARGRRMGERASQRLITGSNESGPLAHGRQVDRYARCALSCSPRAVVVCVVVFVRLSLPAVRIFYESDRARVVNEINSRQRCCYYCRCSFPGVASACVCVCVSGAKVGRIFPKSSSGTGPPVGPASDRSELKSASYESDRALRSSGERLHGEVNILVLPPRQ